MATWFDTARFGMFVHWGHCSAAGLELSWPLVGGHGALQQCQDISVAEYQSTAATFNPQQWDAKALAARAKRLGMQYAVLTTKHHDGFSMYDTKHSDFSIAKGPFGRDVAREFFDALRAEGLRVGVYYSLIDWHHPDYPAYADSDRPYRFTNYRRAEPEAWARFVDFMFAQVRELLTDYGKIDVIWFDGLWERSRVEWKADELAQMIRELQPGILINDRLPGAGDFDTPEQFVPPQPPARPWETCMTINESWGYNKDDDQWKSGRQLIHTLCEVAGRGGNLLLNVSPMGDGRVQPEIAERLDIVQAWMERHSESILGTTPGLEAWQHYGPTTRRDNLIYAHLLSRPYDSVTVRGVRIGRLRKATALGTGTPLAWTTRASIIDSMMKNRDAVGEVTIAVPPQAIDEHATVLALEFDGDPV